MSKYVDIPATMQLIGGIYLNPSLLDQTEYFFNEEDFTEEFHKVLFGSIFNLHALGAKEITLNAIEDYLEQRPKKLALYKTNRGPEYLQSLSKNTQVSAFNYYYNRVKKMTLMRMYNNAGMDLSWLYDVDNILDTKKKQAQEDWLDNHSLAEIADLIDRKITSIRENYVDNSAGTEIVSAGDGIDEFIESLKQVPDIGYPLFGKYMNTITRGARLGKFYLRSAATNVGKTRAMIADACSIGCSERWSLEQKRWIDTGYAEPTFLICVEQTLDECQTMMLAFLAGVDESHILDGEYYEGEWERIMKAKSLLKKGRLKFISMPDFSLQELENIIKRGILNDGCKYIFYDYLSSSMKILEEITKRSGGVSLREDQILFLMATKLKEICVQYDVFLMSSTQLNTNYQESETPDQNLLRGSKACADRIDLGMIMLDVTEKDREALRGVCGKLGVEMPNIKISVYKNRRGMYRSMYLWCNANKGVCQYNPVFATDWRYELMEITDFQIKLKKPVDISAF